MMSLLYSPIITFSEIFVESRKFFLPQVHLVIPLGMSPLKLQPRSLASE